jgi:hypothetical protein
METKVVVIHALSSTWQIVFKLCIQNFVNKCFQAWIAISKLLVLYAWATYLQSHKVVVPTTSLSYSWGGSFWRFGTNKPRNLKLPQFQLKNIVLLLLHHESNPEVGDSWHVQSPPSKWCLLGLIGSPCPLNSRKQPLLQLHFQLLFNYKQSQKLQI